MHFRILTLEMQGTRSTLIRRTRHLSEIRQTLARNPICALLGPRQCGKTTLALELAGGRRDAHVFDLETASGRSSRRYRMPTSSSGARTQVRSWTCS